MGQIKLPNGLYIYFNKSLVPGRKFISPAEAGDSGGGGQIFIHSRKGIPNFDHLTYKQQRVTDGNHNGFTKGQGDHKF